MIVARQLQLKPYILGVVKLTNHPWKPIYKVGFAKTEPTLKSYLKFWNFLLDLKSRFSTKF